MVPVAYAEEVTVNLNHGFNQHKCWEFYLEATNTYTTSCTWSYNPNEREKEIIEAPDVEPEIVEEIIEEIVEEEPERLDTSDPKEVIEYNIEKLKEEKAEKGELDDADDELLKMLESVQEICYFGTDEGKPIQKFAEFIIPTYEPDVETDLKNRWLLNQLFKKQQECQGWEYYKPNYLGPQYLDIETVNIDKAQLIKDALFEKYTTDFTDPVTQGDLDDEAERSLDIICQSTLWGLQFKQDSGCLTAEISVIGSTVPLSTKADKIMSNWQAYIDTGETAQPESTQLTSSMDQKSLTIQYLKSLGWSQEQIDAAIKALQEIP